MTSNRTNSGPQLGLEVTRYDFGIQDERGRAVGTHVYTWEQDFTPAPEGTRAYYVKAPGHYFVLSFHATRNGAPYGALNAQHYFATDAERAAAAAKYLADTRKRYARKYAPKAA